MNAKRSRALCEACGSSEVEIVGESGTYWAYCHSCKKDGPDLSPGEVSVYQAARFARNAAKRLKEIG